MKTFQAINSQLPGGSINIIFSNPWLQAFFLVAGIFPYVFISQYIHPAGDDFAYTASAQDTPLAEALQDEYFTRNGRYFSNLLVLLNPLSARSLFLYRLVPAALILSLIAVFFIFFRQVFSGLADNLRLALLSLLSVLLFLSLMPDLAEGIYWYTGSVSYTAGYVFLLLYGSLVLAAQRGIYLRGKALHYFLMTICLFILCGFNETLTVFMLILHLFIWIYYWVRNKSICREVSAYTALSALFFLLMLLAPGNDVRAGEYPEKYRLVYSLGMASLQTLRFTSHWLSSAPLWMYSIVIFFLLQRIPGKKELKHPFTAVHPFYIVLLMLLLVFISSFLPYYTTGTLGQHRTINTACFFFLPGWVALIFSLHCRNQELADYIAASSRHFYPYLKIILFLLLVFSGNSYLVLNNIRSGQAEAFDRQMLHRYERISSCISAGNSVCEVPYLTAKPESIFVYDIQPDPGHWLNRGYVLYYKRNMLIKSR